jgi:hypothetical protein
MTDEQHLKRVAGFLNYLKEQARQNPHLKADYDKRIAIVANPHSGYNNPPLLPNQGSGVSPKDEALADIERSDWYAYEQEQNMRRRADGN